jgi:hypothetical protein
MLEFEEVTVLADKGPVMLLSACTSLSMFVVSVWSWVRAFAWLCRVAC